jgi:hypothetical protein
MINPEALFVSPARARHQRTGDAGSAVFLGL